MPIRTKDYRDLDFVVGVRTNSGAWLEISARRGETSQEQRQAMEDIVRQLIREQEGGDR